MLEVGCGDGSLARELASAGYDVLAIDPVAPDGPIFRRTTLEELDDPGLFDAVVASLSLHHVHDLGAARGDAVPRSLQALREDWAAEHDGLHGSDVLLAALGARFDERSLEWEPYLWRYVDGVSTRDLEQTLVEVGAIQPLGYRWSGTAR